MCREESMKKLFVFLFSLILSVVFSTTALAYDVEIEGIYYNLNSEGKTAEVTSGEEEYSGEVVIPRSITVEGKEYTVTSIGVKAFVSCFGLTSVTIPNSVTSIGSYAFQYCSRLTSVTIPNSVTSIGDLAFSGCFGLEDAIIVNNMFVQLPVTYSGHYSIPENISQIIGGAFYGNRGLTSVTIPNSVTSIGNSAFYGCRGLTSITIPNSVTSIGDCAFAGCSGLEDIIIVNDMFVHLPETYSGHYSISNNISQIIGGAFYECSSLTSVTIPNSVTSIGEQAFYYCSRLTSVTIPNSVTSIGDMAFFGCSGLTSITIPNSVTSIGYSAFNGCSGLTSVTIPNSVTSIERNAFGGCRGLTSITIPNSVTSIGDCALSCCSGLKDVIIVNNMFVHLPETYSGHYSIPEYISQIIGGAFDQCSGLTSVDIPNSVTSIGDCAFEGCSGLTSVTIPNSVTSIGAQAFYYCSGLTSVTIPNSVTSIGDCAFEGCSGLTSITIPNSVTSIGYDAFSGCRGLTSVTIPNSVTSIGQDAFSYCSGLTSVTIGNSVTSIGDYAFRYCSKLEDVYCYTEKVPSTDATAFEESNIASSTLHVPTSALSSYQATAPWSGFGTIKALAGTEVETQKCEKPVISYANGELDFTCSTEGVEFASEIKCKDVNKFNTSKVSLSACYDISVTATKAGYEDSDVATAKLYWLTTSGTLDTNINTAKTRGVVIQSAGGFITLSGLDTNERVEFFTVDGVALGSATATDGTATFSATSGTIVVAKIGKESVKIAVE